MKGFNINGASYVEHQGKLFQLILRFDGELEILPDAAVPEGQRGPLDACTDEVHDMTHWVELGETDLCVVTESIHGRRRTTRYSLPLEPLNAE